MSCQRTAVRAPYFKLFKAFDLALPATALYSTNHEVEQKKVKKKKKKSLSVASLVSLGLCFDFLSFTMQNVLV